MNEHERLLWSYTLAVNAWLEALDKRRRTNAVEDYQAALKCEEEVRSLTALHMLPVPPSAQTVDVSRFRKGGSS